VSCFENLLTKYCSLHYIKSFLIKRVVSSSRDQTTMLRTHTKTTRTAGIPTRPGPSYQLLVPRTQCYNWTKPDTLQFKWKNNHSRAIPLAAKYTRLLFFPIESAQHMMLFCGLGQKMTGCICLEVAIGRGGQPPLYK